MNYIKTHIILISLVFICVLQSCKPEEELTAKVPSLYTTNLTNITDSSAVSGGDIISSGAGFVTERGVCWAIFPQPTIDNYKTSDGSGTGVFTSNIYGLNAETYYYVRAYATNSAGTGYGDDIKFFATSTPVVTTADVTDVTSYSAVCGGNVISDGGSQITDKGICWDTKPHPTIEDFHVFSGQGLGSFVSIIEGLMEDTIYYLRAYATSENGITGYGEELIFKPVFICSEDFRDNRDGKIYSSVLIGNICWMKQNLNYGTYVTSSTGQDAFGTQKFCYDNNSTFCDVYGGMYTWTEIMDGSLACNGTGETQPECNNHVQGICPIGWHIPSHFEWTTLEKLAGSEPDSFPFNEVTKGWLGVDEGNNLKINNPIYWNNEGQNTLTFNGLASGYYLGVYGYINERCKWWTSTESGKNNAWHRGLEKGQKSIYRLNINKSFAFSLRCVKNN